MLGTVGPVEDHLRTFNPVHKIRDKMEHWRRVRASPREPGTSSLSLTTTTNHNWIFCQCLPLDPEKHFLLTHSLVFRILLPEQMVVTSSFLGVCLHQLLAQRNSSHVGVCPHVQATGKNKPCCLLL